MKKINKKRAEIVINNPIIATDGDCRSTISTIISTLLLDCPSYSELISCTEKCPEISKSYNILKLHSRLNANFDNLLDAMWANFPTKKCTRCNEPAVMKIEFAPIIFIEVF